MNEYILWCRRTNDPDALWQFMPYARRTLQECLWLKAHYEEEWGNHYEYEVHKAGRYGTRPKGMRVPAFSDLAD